MSRWRDNPANVKPMLASLDEAPIFQRGLVYEPKYDGIRALADVRPPSGRGKSATVAIYSRNGREKHQQFPAIAKALEALASRLKGPLLLDGEIVAVDREGRPLGFQHIQGRIHLTAASDILKAEAAQPAVFVAFDLLRDGDEDLRGQPLAARRLRLQERLKRPGLRARQGDPVSLPSRTRQGDPVSLPIRTRQGDPVSSPSRANQGDPVSLLRVSELLADDGRPMLARANAEGWEGLIVKDGHSPYQSGRRSPSWRKMKITHAQEFVVGGWTEPRESRAHFGALVLGYHDEKGLRWAGSVGTGFDQKELDRVAALLARRTAKTSPFVDNVSTLERAHWVRPDLVAEVRFTEWTSDGLLRHPVYLGLRDDKPAGEIVREAKARRAERPAVPIPASRWHRGKGPLANDKNQNEVPPMTAADRAGQKTGPKGPAATRAVRKASPKGPASTSLNGLVAELAALEKAKKDAELALPNGDVLRVTNLAKVFWPDLGITKGELIRFYASVSPLLLPVVDDRPLVMRRFPNGVATHAFYQQRHPEAPPKGVRREVLPEEVEPITDEGPRDRLIGGSLTTLLYMAQLAAISQDPWFSRVADPFQQDHAAVDLDPGDGTPFSHVIEVAQTVKRVLDEFGIPGFPKTSGASGLHIYIPMPKRATYETGQLLCHMIASAVVERKPKIATIERMVKRRPKGTVYVDYLQNILGKTLATAYSVRASDYAGVSTPLEWDEVNARLDPRKFTIRTALDRFAKVGDLWAGLRTGPAVDLKRIVSRKK